MLFARKMADGYHYGASSPIAPHAGELFAIKIEGEGEIVPPPDSPASEESHQKWIADLRSAGWQVDVESVDEPAE